MTQLDVFKLLSKYCGENQHLYTVLVVHGELVAKKALAIAQKLKLDVKQQKFIWEAGVLHDIGKTVLGNKPYLTHGILGREILEKEGLPEHALVCERHIGTGITIEDIEKQSLPLPKRDMTPQTIAEEIICFADKFYSKSHNTLAEEKSIDEIRAELAALDEKKMKKFDEWLEKFS